MKQIWKVVAVVATLAVGCKEEGVPSVGVDEPNGAQGPPPGKFDPGASTGTGSGSVSAEGDAGSDPSSKADGATGAAEGEDPLADCVKEVPPPDYPEYGKEPQGQPSSRQWCLCWPEGHTCTDGKNVTKQDDKLACPTGELCSGGMGAWVSGGNFPGRCYKPCYHPDATYESEEGCHATEFCKLVSILIMEHKLKKVGFCFPKKTEPGLDFSDCPPDNKWGPPNQ